MKKAVVLGAGGFIGGHLVKRLKTMGYYVKGVDIKNHEYATSVADEFVLADLRILANVESVIDDDVSEVYQLAADMGGAEYIFTGANDADIMHNSALINLNVCDVCSRVGAKTFYSSSACVYPEHNQTDENNPYCAEESVYPANPDSEYGWEKIFSERLYLSYMRNKGLDVKIARFHNIFGPYGTWYGGKEKAPAAICRKVASAQVDGIVSIFGDGKQTRSFLYIDECIDGIMRLMNSPHHGPVNIGSDEMVSINTLTEYIIDIAGKKCTIDHVEGPQGVRGRTSDNSMVQRILNWRPSKPLKEGLRETYQWILSEMNDHTKEY